MADQATWKTELLKELEARDTTPELTGLIDRVKNDIIDEGTVVDELKAMGDKDTAQLLADGSFNTQAQAINIENSGRAPVEGETEHTPEPGRDPLDVDTSQGSVVPDQIKENLGNVAEDTKATTENTEV